MWPPLPRRKLSLLMSFYCAVSLVQRCREPKWNSLVLASPSTTGITCGARRRVSMLAHLVESRRPPLQPKCVGNVMIPHNLEKMLKSIAWPSVSRDITNSLLSRSPPRTVLLLARCTTSRKGYSFGFGSPPSAMVLLLTSSMALSNLCRSGRSRFQSLDQRFLPLQICQVLSYSAGLD